MPFVDAHWKRVAAVVLGALVAETAPLACQSDQIGHPLPAENRSRWLGVTTAGYHVSWGRSRREVD